jgi:hypothetical protein
MLRRVHIESKRAGDADAPPTVHAD